MNYDDIKEIEFSQYNAAHFIKLKKAKNVILKTIKKYMPEDGQDTAIVWDQQEEIEKDVQFVSAYLFYMAPVIGYLEGLANNSEEHKKIHMARIRKDIIEKESELKKKTTKEDKDAISRTGSEESIEVMIQLTSMGMEYRRFLYQANEWIKTARFRVMTLNKERNLTGM